jgi:hypothetical protein
MIVLARALSCLIGILGILSAAFFFGSAGPAAWMNLLVGPLLILLSTISPKGQSSLSRNMTVAVLVLLPILVVVEIAVELTRGTPPVYAVLVGICLSIYFVAFMRTTRPPHNA